MKKREVIAYKNLPTRLPISRTILITLALSYWNAPGWLWGVVMTFLGLIWINSLILLFTQEYVDIFEATELAEVRNFVSNGKSKFMQKLQEAMKITHAEKTKMKDIRQGDSEY